MVKDEPDRELLEAARTALRALELVQERKGQQFWLDIAGDRFRGRAITDQLRAAIERAEGDGGG
jgi:hypothetical protein